MSHRIYPSVGSPLLTVVATRLSREHSIVHLSMDLLICDAYSARIIDRDLLAVLTHRDRPLEPLRTSFRDFVHAASRFEQTPEFAKARDYWIARAGAFPPPPALPLRLQRLHGRRSSRFRRLEWHMPASAWPPLRAESVRRGLTPSGVLCSAFAQILGMWSAERRFAINMTLFDRFPHHPQVNDLVGVFTTTFLLEVEHESVPFATFAQRLQQRLWADIEHRHFNGVRFLRELRTRGALDALGYPIVFTSTLGNDGDSGETFPWRGECTYAISQTSGVLVDCQIAESDDTLYLNWDVVEDAFEPGSVQQMFGTYTRLIDALHANAGAWNLSCR